MKGFVFAIQFLTIIPAPAKEPFAPDKAIPFFPVAGILIGLLLAAFDTMVLRFWPAPVAAVLDVIFLAVITGALHLDGLGDTADGLYGRWPRDKALAIMKDSRIGAIGMILVACCLGLKWSGLFSLTADRAFVLVLVPAYARSGALFGMHLLPYGRSQGGTGHSFFDRPLTVLDYWGVGIMIGLSFLIGGRAVFLILGFLIITAGTLFFYKRRMACITGDMLGAMIEIIETTLFLIMAAGDRL